MVEEAEGAWLRLTEAASLSWENYVRAASDDVYFFQAEEWLKHTKKQYKVYASRYSKGSKPYMCVLRRGAGELYC